MAYEGKNKEKVEQLKSLLSDESFKEVVDAALTGRGNETQLDTIFDKASISDREKLAEIYLLSRDEYTDKLTEATPYLVKIFSQLGFNTYDNPIMAWLDNYFSLPANKSEQLPAEAVRALNNLYAQKAISPDILQGKNGTDSLLYNKYLWDMHEDDINFYLALDKKLSNANTIKALNLEAIPGFADATPEQVKSLLLFGTKDGKANFSPLVPVGNIKEALEKLGLDGAGGRVNQPQSNDVAKITKQLKGMTKEEIAGVIKAVLDSVPGLADELRG